MAENVKITGNDFDIRKQPLPKDTIAPKTDPSVRLGPLEGEPRGSVPMDVTIGKPRAYYPAKPGPK